MPLVARNNIDAVGGTGTQRSGPQGFVRINGELAVVIGWEGDSHPPCPFPIIHCAGFWVMAQGSAFVKINGIPVCRFGDNASCGHPTTGSGHVIIAS